MISPKDLASCALTIQKHCATSMCEDCIFSIDKVTGIGCMFNGKNTFPQDWENRYFSEAEVLWED